MLEFSWRLIGCDGEIRLQEKLKTKTFPNLWKILVEIADDFGRPGEVMQVLDERDQIVIHVGVATAQGLPLRPLRALQASRRRDRPYAPSGAPEASSAMRIS